MMHAGIAQPPTSEAPMTQGLGWMMDDRGGLGVEWPSGSRASHAQAA
jgi:hypothetical protein